MNREILFRGRRTDSGEWIEGLLYQISEDQNPFIMLKNSNAESHEVVAETVGQFTGILDRHGEKIFEGDRVLAFDALGRPDGAGIVGWNALFCAWMLNGNQSMYGKAAASYEVWREP